MFGKDFQRKYALTDQGVKNTKQATLWTVVVNLVVMGGMGILYLLMQRYMGTLAGGADLPKGYVFLLLVLGFLVLSIATHLQQYRATYGLVYGEVKQTRLRLAERLRKLPLGYFGKRDLADLTETILGDVNRLEHVWSHCLGYLYVYRPAKLAEDLCHETAKNILERHGYVPSLPGQCVSCLRRKLQTDADFPHEIGLFLGYPPEDVCGFIEHKAAGYKCVGCWKVYGDAEQAQKTFAIFKKCTDVYCRQYAAGKPVERLTVAG